MGLFDKFKKKKGQEEISPEEELTAADADEVAEELSGRETDEELLSDTLEYAAEVIEDSFDTE